MRVAAEGRHEPQVPGLEIEKALSIRLVADLLDVLDVGLLGVVLLVRILRGEIGRLRHRNEALPIRRPGKTADAVAQRRNLPGFAAIDAQQPQLRLLAAIGQERDVLPVRGPTWRAILGICVSQPPRSRAVDRGHIDRRAIVVLLALDRRNGVRDLFIVR